MLQRRTVLEGLAALAVTQAFPAVARAALMRVVSLPALLQSSMHVLQAVPLDVTSQWETVGEQRRIVSYTRVRAEELIAGSKPESSELLVRTLGGHVGDVGQVVFGEAALRVNEPCLLFLRRAVVNVEQVVAMAQGHYPILSDSSGARRLLPSPNLSELRGSGDSAVRALVGLRLDQAKGLIRGVR